jgi:hypothetical protein
VLEPEQYIETVQKRTRVAVPQAADSTAPAAVLGDGDEGLRSMGQSDDAERFRLLLAEELKKARFAIADNADSAGGVITGTVTVQAHDTLVFATVVLNAPSGERLWHGDFHPHKDCRREYTI